MPLPPTLYHLSHSSLRPDGRRWNELRRTHAQISTQPSADGSSYLEHGNTKVICTVSGPAEAVKGTGTVTGGRREGAERENAVVGVEIGVAGFAGVDRKVGKRGDRRITEMQNTIASAFTATLFTHLYPQSTILIRIHVLSSDGSLLAAAINATTLALIDAGIPTRDYICACTAGLTPPSPDTQVPDPILDLNGQEEQELAFLTVGTVGGGERVSVCVGESRVQWERVEGMLAVGVDGCKRVRDILDGVVRARGRKVVGGGGH